MTEKISVPVSVEMAYDHKTKRVYPKFILWENKFYPVVQVGFHHTYYEGKTLFHVFSVLTKTLFFKLVLNTQNLFWRLEEISDGLPD